MTAPYSRADHDDLVDWAAANMNLTMSTGQQSELYGLLGNLEDGVSCRVRHTARMYTADGTIPWHDRVILEACLRDQINRDAYREALVRVLSVASDGPWVG